MAIRMSTLFPGVSINVVLPRNRVLKVGLCRAPPHSSLVCVLPVTFSYYNFSCRKFLPEAHKIIFMPVSLFIKNIILTFLALFLSHLIIRLSITITFTTTAIMILRLLLLSSSHLPRLFSVSGVNMLAVRPRSDGPERDSRGLLAHAKLPFDESGQHILVTFVVYCNGIILSVTADTNTFIICYRSYY